MSESSYNSGQSVPRDDGWTSSVNDAISVIMENLKASGGVADAEKMLTILKAASEIKTIELKQSLNELRRTQMQKRLR